MPEGARPCSHVSFRPLASRAREETGSYAPCFAVAAAGTRHATVLSTKVTQPELWSVTSVSVFCTRPLSMTNTGTVASGPCSVAPKGPSMEGTLQTTGQRGLDACIELVA